MRFTPAVAALPWSLEPHVGNHVSLYAIFCLIVGGIPRNQIRVMKERPNHRIYVRVLREMGPENRLRKAFELSEFSRALTRRGLEGLHPGLPASELTRLYLDRMKKARERPE
jgi:hypothetical protein